MRLLLFIYTFFYCFENFTSAQTFQWAEKFGGSSFSETQVNSIACDISGNIYLTGFFSGTVDFDPGIAAFNLTASGTYDAFLVKLSPAGNFSFALRFGGSGSTTSGSVVKIDQLSNIYISGTTTNTADFDPGTGTFAMVSNTFEDCFVCKLTPSGTLSWAKRFGGSDYDHPGGLVFDASNNPVITGLFSTSVDFDPGPATNILTSAGGSDIFILKLDANGNFLFVKQIGGVNSDEAKTIDIDASGNLFLSGYFLGAVDFDPSASVFLLTGAGYSSMFILKLNSAGIFQWAKAAQLNGSVYPRDLKVSSAGNIYITGSFKDTVDFDPGTTVVKIISNGIEDVFILKLNTAGNFSWVNRIGGTGNDRGINIYIDNAENIFLTGNIQDAVDLNPGAGTFNVTSQGVYDMFSVKLNSAGAFQFGYRIGSSGYDEGHAVALNPADCNLLLAGPFQQTVDFDPGTGVFNLVAGSFSADSYIQKMSTVNASCNPVTLPVELLFFNGELNGNDVDLTWTTASEINSESFEIQKSYNGSDFSSIGTISGSGNSRFNIDYHFKDQSPFSPLTYYRLKQNDFDGHFTYSGIIAIKSEITENIIVSAQPVTNRINILFPDHKSGELIIVDMNGKIVYRKEISGRTEIDCSKLISGVYCLVINSDEINARAKFIKN